MFPPAINGHFYEQALRKLENEPSQNTYIRLRLVFQQNVSPEIVNLPWEFLYNEEDNKFLATYPKIMLCYQYDDWLANSIDGYLNTDDESLRVLFVHTHPTDLSR